MRRVVLALYVGFALLGAPMLIGCEREVSHKESTEVKPDGTKVHEEKTVTENPDTGTVTKTEEKTVDKPDDR